MKLNFSKIFRNDFVPEKDVIDPQLIHEDIDLNNEQLFKKHVPRIFPSRIAREILSYYPDLNCRRSAQLAEFKDRSMIIMGEPGTGKTFAACMIVLFSWRINNKINWYYLSFSVIFMTVPDMLEKLRSLAINGNKVISESGKTEYDQYIYDLKMCRFLILDDLGTEKQTDFANSALDSIIDNRYQSGWRHTIITTNLTIEEMDTSKGHGRILSRINDIGEILQMTKKYRKKGISIKQMD